MNRNSSYRLGLMALIFSVSIPLSFADGQKQTVVGYVYDSACYYTKDLRKPISHKCAEMCAKAGSPLVIVTKEGTVYLPVDKGIPSKGQTKGQNVRLVKYGGMTVKATGEVFERAGSKAIVIDTIELVKR